MALNVNRAVSDPFYRYKMPKILAKVEGKGNGIKTVIANMVDVAKALERPPMYPTKYFGCELGAQTNFDNKNDRYIVNGEHDANKLQDILDGFIKKFVLCPSCDNPETALTVKKNQINSKCKACGHAFIIDNKHKVSTFIIKNPPKIEVDLTKVKENGKKHKEKTSGETNGSNKSSNDEDDDDDDWADPIDDPKLVAGIGKLVIDKDLEKSQDERLDMLHKYFQKRKEANDIGDGKELTDEAERLDLKQKAPILFADVFFNQDIIAENQLKTYRRVLLRFTLQDKKAQKYLMGGIEQLIMKHESELLPKAAHIIKALYDHDIIEEEALLAWGEKPSSKYVSKTNAKKIIEKCEKVLIWLKEAEEDSEEESEDEIEFDDRNRHVGEFAAKVNGEATKEEIKVANEDGEEIDIDDI